MSDTGTNGTAKTPSPAEIEAGLSALADLPGTSPPAQTPAPAPVPAPAPAEWRPADDPYAPPPYMVRIAPLYFVWTLEAIEQAAYQYEVSPGKFERRYRPLDGLLLERVGEPGKGDPCVIVWLLEPALVSDCRGQLREAPRGRRVFVHCNHNLRELVPHLSAQGAVHCRIYPTGWDTLASGAREMTFLVVYEPDPVDPQKLKLVSRQSVTGAGAGAASGGAA